MKKPLYIFGAGGLGREIYAMLKSSAEWEVKGFYDDRLSVNLAEETPCLGGLDALVRNQNPLNLVVALGNPQVKETIVSKLTPCKWISFPILIHPSAQILDPTKISLGPGTIITAGCVITTHVKIEKHVLVNLNSTIGHDVHIGESSSIMPGVHLAGNVKLGKGVLLGSGVNVLNGITIQDRAIVGAGAVVVRDVLQGTTVLGVPARSIER